MILTFDIGNTNTVMVGYEDDKVVYEKSFPTIKEAVFEKLTSELSEVNKNEVSAIVISNVVPRIQDDITKTLELYFDKKCYYVNASSVPSFKCELEKPKEIGSDLLATSYAAYKQYNTNCIVVDIGSASKITLTNEDGVFKGGLILPGFKTSLESLYSYIPHLPQISFEIPETIIGTTTPMAIQSGVFYGLISQIEGLAHRIEKEHQKTCVLVLTGGYANIIHMKLPEFNFIPHLVNQGLYELYVDHKIEL